MATAKQRLEELEAVFAALAHPARRQILLTIWFRGGVLGSGDITARFCHAWPTTVRHLRVLEEAGLLTHERQGRSVSYRVNRRKLDVVRDWLRWFEVPRKERRNP
jgi:DNA-binding transcriptional ArsR family regulator